MVSSEQVQMIKDLHKSSRETCQNISSEHKDIHASISKFGRAIDKVSTIPCYLRSEPLYTVKGKKGVVNSLCKICGPRMQELNR